MQVSFLLVLPSVLLSCIGIKLAYKDVSGQIRYLLLSELAKAVLIILQGNADTEHMFSHIMRFNKKIMQQDLILYQHYSDFRLIDSPCFNFISITQTSD